MHIELIENPLLLAKHNAQTATLALHDHQGFSCAVRGDSVDDETRSSEERGRLLLSWRAVLGEIGCSEVGAGRW